MTRQCSRRGFFAVAGAAVLAMPAACRSHEDAQGVRGEVRSDGSVVVKHTFGETTVPAPPKRVVSAGLTEQDDLLAVGVVPVAVTNWWGDQPFAVWPWARSKLGSARPTVLELADGLQFDRIAALKPDLIVACNAGVDRDSYERLSAIAPTIPQSGDEPFFEPWKTQAAAVGRAVFQSDQMQSLISAVDDKFSRVAEANPGFQNTKVLLLQGSLDNVDGTDQVVATLPGWRTEFLTRMGLSIPDSIDAFTRPGDYRAVIPADNVVTVLDAADVLIWTTESAQQRDTLLDNDNVKQLTATRQNRNIFTGRELGAAIAFSSPLSLPVVAEQLAPMLAQALSV